MEVHVDFITDHLVIIRSAPYHTTPHNTRIHRFTAHISHSTTPQTPHKHPIANVEHCTIEDYIIIIIIIIILTVLVLLTR